MKKTTKTAKVEAEKAPEVKKASVKKAEAPAIEKETEQLEKQLKKEIEEFTEAQAQRVDVFPQAPLAPALAPLPGPAPDPVYVPVKE